MNKAESRRAAEELEKLGYLPTDKPFNANVVILNSCVVRESAEQRVWGRLSSLKPLKSRAAPPLVILMGCAVNSDIASLRERFPHVDAFFKPADVDGVIDFVKSSHACCRQYQMTDDSFSSALPVAVYLPIIHGCNNFCTYCIVPYRRGRERSRPLDEIVTEARDLVARGAREITLLGQNVDSYGHDLPNKPDLADVLTAVHEISDLWRLRFLTSHPKDMSDKLIKTVAQLPKVCEYIELAVQSGDDEILRRMRRGYNNAHYRKLVDKIRAAIPHVSVSTDVIVGFPGETEAQFMNTYNLLQDMCFDVVHVAMYSPRTGTVAARLPDDIPVAEKERRRKMVEDLQERVVAEINAPLVGQTVKILVEERRKGRWGGRTRTNKLVFFEDKRDWRGELAEVRITWAGAWSMVGELQE